jgi:hypothetical protein
MPIIQSGRELYIATHRLLGEQHGNGWACPWCRALGEYEVDDESTSDRLFLSTRMEPKYHPVRFICRMAAKGLVNHHSVHSVEELFSEFGQEPVTLAPGKTWDAIAYEYMAAVGLSTPSAEIDESKALWEVVDIIQLHQRSTTYDEWAKVGVSADIVDRLHLGVTAQGRLSIPIPYLVPDGDSLRIEGRYVQRTRRVEGSEYGPKYKWPAGLSPSLWYIKGDVSKPLIIVEGDTSTIAATALWPDHAIATTTGGAGYWADSMTRYLLAQGHKTFYIYYDHDDSGLRYAQLIIQSVRRIAEWTDIEIMLVLWPAESPAGYDPRAVLKEYGVERARTLLDQWIVPNGWFSMLQPDTGKGRVHAQWDEEYARGEYAERYAAARQQLYTVEELRGGRIRQEIDQYVKGPTVNDEGESSLLLIRSTPGVGKTREAVRYAEAYALDYLARRQKAAQRRLDQLRSQPQTEEVQEKIKHIEDGRYKKLSVVFVGAFVDGFDDLMQHVEHPELWYNFKARGSATCQSYGLTQQVATAGYNIMKSCCIEGGSCPLRDQCLGLYNGEVQYLAQLNEVQFHPIVYLRHNHLYMKDLLKKAKLIIVDEDPSSVALSAVTLSVSDIKRFDASLMLESEDASVVNRIMESVVEAVESWTAKNKMLMDRSLIDHLIVRSGDRTLHELATYVQQYGLLDKIAEWTPFDFDTAPSGRIVDLLTLLVYDILRTDDRWNGQIFIEDQHAIFYPMSTFPIDPKKPVVVLDATGIVHKYELIFGRSVKSFFAEVYPEHAHTFIVTNTEHTMNVLLKGVTKRTESVQLYGVRDSVTQAIRSKPQNMAVLNNEACVVNTAIRDVIRMTLGLTAKHGQLLLVTYKTARLLIEEFINEHFPDYASCIGFGHFKALRGLNLFENVPAVLVAGTPRMPPQVLQRDLIAFHKNDPEPLDLTPMRTDAYYHLTPWRYPVLTLADTRPTVAAYMEEVEAGEIQQVVGRIRAAVSDTDKYIYLMTARPAMTWCTYTGPGQEGWSGDTFNPAHNRHFTTLQSAAWKWYESEEAVQHIMAWVDTYGDTPSVTELMRATGYTRYKAHKTKQFWEYQNNS